MKTQSTFYSISNFKSAILRVCKSLETNYEYFTKLDQAIGDGDLGITLRKIANALSEYSKTSSVDDIGQFLIGAGLVTNRAGSSSFGTLISTALIRAGGIVKGSHQISIKDVSEILVAATLGIQDRGKAQLNDKTVLDVLIPATHALKNAVDSAVSLNDAGMQMIEAAKGGLDRVTPLKSQIGRAAWLGEQTIGKIDPGCAAAVIILEAIIQIEC